MRVSYQFSSGLLAITMYETPFRLNAEFKDLDGFSWYSAKYTAGSISKLKLVDCVSKHSIATMDEQITSIWHAILRQPTIAITSNQMIVTIATGVNILLVKEKIMPRLEPVVESPSECENDCEYDHDEYDVAKCTLAKHLRCAHDISVIRDLESENDRLRAEIVLLRKLTLRDNSLPMCDSILTHHGLM